jgi:Tfp pilus assembly protein PilE
VAKRLLRRLRSEDGFGIIELSVAIVMLNVGILALVAAFNSGAVTLARSSKIANATVIADKILEQFRGYRNCQIFLNVTTTDSTYLNDTALPTHTASSEMTGSPSTSNPTASTTYPPIPAPCGTNSYAATTSAYVGPDGRKYRVDVYILPVKLQTSAGYQKQVTVVVRDASLTSTPVLARETSTYDPYSAP